MGVRGVSRRDLMGTRKNGKKAEKAWRYLRVERVDMKSTRIDLIRISMS